MIDSRKKIINIDLPNENNSFYTYLENHNYNLHKLLIFVFGSNLGGFHGASAAKYAMLHHHAVYGIGKGIQGGSYAIPTKGYYKRKVLQILTLDKIKTHVDDFLEYNRTHDKISFFVTAIGTGLAGYRDSEIAPMFKGAKRCWFPKSWEKYIREDKVNG